METAFSLKGSGVAIFKEQMMLTKNTKLIVANHFKATTEQKIKSAVRKNIVRLLVVECHADTSVL